MVRQVQVKHLIMAFVLALGCNANHRQDQDLSALYMRVTAAEEENDRMRQCILRLSSDMRVEDVVTDLHACLGSRSRVRRDFAAMRRAS